LICYDGQHKGWMSRQYLRETPTSTTPISTQAEKAKPIDTLSQKFTALLPESIYSPRIVVRKAERQLELYDGERLFGYWHVALGWEPKGKKEREGDGKTPEGEYYICTRNDASRYYLSLGLSYPNKKDAERGLASGIVEQSAYNSIIAAIERGDKPPWNTEMGGEIMIHGNGSSRDWTAGCIALENEAMDILWRYCSIGTEVKILP
jgi:murein L,D-transpeptidase YafK